MHSSLEDPYPPSLDEVTTRFPGALFTLQQQPSVEEIAVGTIVHTTNEQSRYLSAAITYTLWRRPENRDDPANLAAVCPGTRGHHRMLIPHGRWALVGNPNRPDGLRMVRYDLMAPDEAARYGLPPPPGPSP